MKNQSYETQTEFFGNSVVTFGIHSVQGEMVKMSF